MAQVLKETPESLNRQNPLAASNYCEGFEMVSADHRPVSPSKNVAGLFRTSSLRESAVSSGERSLLFLRKNVPNKVCEQPDADQSPKRIAGCDSENASEVESTCNRMQPGTANCKRHNHISRTTGGQPLYHSWVDRDATDAPDSDQQGDNFTLGGVCRAVTDRIIQCGQNLLQKVLNILSGKSSGKPVTLRVNVRLCKATRKLNAMSFIYVWLEPEVWKSVMKVQLVHHHKTFKQKCTHTLHLNAF